MFRGPSESQETIDRIGASEGVTVVGEAVEEITGVVVVLVEKTARIAMPALASQPVLRARCHMPQTAVALTTN